MVGEERELLFAVALPMDSTSMAEEATEIHAPHGVFYELLNSLSQMKYPIFLVHFWPQ